MELKESIICFFIEIAEEEANARILGVAFCSIIELVSSGLGQVSEKNMHVLNNSAAKSARSKIISVALVLLISVISVGYYNRKIDPFSAYKDESSFSKSLETTLLLNYAPEEKLIIEKLKLELSPRERSIIAGIHWLVRFADKEENLEQIFSYFILFLHEMMASDKREHQREVAQIILKKTLAIGQKKLSSFYKKDESGRWEFIGILPILAHHREFEATYFKFYQEYFSQIVPPYQSNDMTMSEAIKQNNYTVIGDYLIYGSFLHYYLLKAKQSAIVLPNNQFEEYLKELERFEYKKDYDYHSIEFRDLAYLATHVVLVLTNYGEFPLEKSLNSKKAESFIDFTFKNVRYHVGDLDLLSEYVQCLKILKPLDPRISPAEKFIFSLQRQNGSWGRGEDFFSSPYNAFHPSWAALTALNHPL